MPSADCWLCIFNLLSRAVLSVLSQKKNGFVQFILSFVLLKHAVKLSEGLWLHFIDMNSNRKIFVVN